MNFKKQYLKPSYYSQTNYLYPIDLLVLDSNSWNYLTVCKQINSGSFKNNVTNKPFTNHTIYKLPFANHIIYIYV